MEKEVNIKDLYKSGTPFSVIKAEEITGTIWSAVYRNSGIKTHELKKDELSYFFKIEHLAKRIDFGYEGSVFEYFNFRSKLDKVVRYQFIEGLNRGRK